jgi:hypothetical protein
VGELLLLKQPQQIELPQQLKTFYAIIQTLLHVWKWSVASIIIWTSMHNWRTFFCLNLDETCFMASEGTLRVVGSNKKTKQEKNSNDSQDSITVVHIGSADGTEGPHIFLAKGKSF